MTVPLNPVGAAVHAIVIQGGYTTPAIEAGRILTDALHRRRLFSSFDEEWVEGICATLLWLDGHADKPDVRVTIERLEHRWGTDWRASLTDAVAKPAEPEPQQ